MADIFDLIPAIATVEAGGTSTEVRAIQLGQCLEIMNRFPALKEFPEGKVTFAQILETGAVPAICAAGCGRYKDAEAEMHFAALDADTQTNFLGAILRLTMPRGINPFLISLGEFGTIFTGPPQPKLMTREEIAKRLVRKNSGGLSPSSSPNTEAPSANTPSGL